MNDWSARPLVAIYAAVFKTPKRAIKNLKRLLHLRPTILQRTFWVSEFNEVPYWICRPPRRTQFVVLSENEPIASNCLRGTKVT